MNDSNFRWVPKSEGIISTYCLQQVCKIASILKKLCVKPVLIAILCHECWKALVRGEKSMGGNRFIFCAPSRGFMSWPECSLRESIDHDDKAGNWMPSSWMKYATPNQQARLTGIKSPSSMTGKSQLIPCKPKSFLNPAPMGMRVKSRHLFGQDYLWTENLTYPNQKPS